MNILDPILAQCRLNPALPALCAPGTAVPIVSYGRLLGMIRSVGRQADHHSLKAGMTVAILCADPILHAALTLGLTSRGIVTLSARSTRLPAECQVAAVISDAAQAVENGGRVIAADNSWLANRDEDDAHAVGAADDLCRIILTSGTTGDPKAVALTHRMVSDRLALHTFAFGATLPNCDRLFCDLGASTSLGFLFLLHTLMRGGTLFFRGSDASQTMQAFGLYRVDAMIASPSGLMEFLDYYEHSPAFAAPFRLIITAGSSLSPTLSQRVRARLSSNLFSLYGSTEASMIATASAHILDGTPNAVGRVLPGVSIEATDPSGHSLPAGQKGFLRIRNERMASGYMDASQGEGPFRDGWFYPGDIGAVTPDRLLLLFGRDNAVINLGGDKLNPETIEQAMLACPGVIDAAAFTESNDLGVEQLRVAVVAGTGLDEAMLLECCARIVPPERLPANVLRVAALPRNTSGKLDRAQLSALAAGDGRQDR